MAKPVSPSVVQAFYQAYASCNAARIAPLIADDVRWSVVGPSHIFPFCGERMGKQAVVDLVANIVPTCIHFCKVDPEIMLVDGKCAAAFVKLTGHLHNTGRIITYHCGQFVCFEDDKVVSFQSIIDSFDAAEQALGHHIDPMHEPATCAAISPDNAIVAI